MSIHERKCTQGEIQSGQYTLAVLNAFITTKGKKIVQSLDFDRAYVTDDNTKRISNYVDWNNKF